MNQLASPPLKSILRYPGGKARIATWIVRHLPPHDTYVEPFFGGGSVLFAKKRARIEAINDIDHRVVNLFRVLRDQPDELLRVVSCTPYARAEYEISDQVSNDPIEDARRFLVRVQMGHAGQTQRMSGWRQGSYGGYGNERGSIARPWAHLDERIAPAVERLSEVMIECRPALDVISRWNSPEALIYADPPYVRGSRISSDGLYRHEMSDDDHLALLNALNAHPGPVVLSGYPSSLYDGPLRHWSCIQREARTYGASTRIECLWLNPVATEQKRQISMFGGDA